MDFDQELKQVADAYASQGYQVTIRPNPEALPSFAKDFKIEILGKRGTEGVLVAVKKDRDEVAADSNLTRYAEITGLQKGGGSTSPSWRQRTQAPGRLMGREIFRKKT